MYSKDSYVKKSGQSWKILVVAILAVGSTLGFLIPLNLPSVRDGNAKTYVLFVFGGILLGFASVLWLALAIRCRKCGVRLGWKAIREQSVHLWFIWLVTHSHCPVCGDNFVE